MEVHGEYAILQTSQDWIVKRLGGEYSQHSHHANKSDCRKIIRLLELNIMPKSDYLKGSAKRLLSEDEYRQLGHKKKPIYINKRCSGY